MTEVTESQTGHSIFRASFGTLEDDPHVFVFVFVFNENSTQ